MAKWKNEKLLCHAALIEELLDEGYRYILTPPFQSDLSERFENYEQMSGGRFLVSLKEMAIIPKKIMKLKCLLKEDDNALTEDIFLKKDEEEKLQIFLFDITSEK